MSKTSIWSMSDEKIIDNGEEKHTLSTKIDVLNSDSQFRYRASASPERNSKTDILGSTDIRHWLANNSSQNAKLPAKHNDTKDDIRVYANKFKEECLDNVNKFREEYKDNAEKFREACKDNGNKINKEYKDNENKSKEGSWSNLKRSCENKSTENRVNIKNSSNEIGTNENKLNEANSNKSREEIEANNSREESRVNTKRSNENRTNLNRSDDNKSYESTVSDSSRQLTKRLSRPKRPSVNSDVRSSEDGLHKTTSKLYMDGRQRSCRSRQSTTPKPDDYYPDHNGDTSDIQKRQQVKDMMRQRQQQQIQMQNVDGNFEAERRLICSGKCPHYNACRKDDEVTLPTISANWVDGDDGDDRSANRKEERQQRLQRREEKRMANIQKIEDDIARMELESSDILRSIKRHQRAQQQLATKQEQLQNKIVNDKQNLMELQRRMTTGRMELQKQERERSQQERKQQILVQELDESASQNGQRSLSVIINLNLNCNGSTRHSPRLEAGATTIPQRNSTRSNFTSSPLVTVRTRRHHVYKHRNLR